MAGSASFFLWAIAGLVGVATVAPQIDRAVAGPDTAAARDVYWVPRAPDGQYYLEGRAGPTAIRFLVDGGSADIVLTADDAARIGIDAHSGPARIGQLQLGRAVLRDVPVRVARDLPVSLIGRQYLSGQVGAEFQRDRIVLP